MLRIAFAFAAILAATSAQAQPFPGAGPLIGSGAIQGPHDYSDWQATRRDRGLDFDRDALDRRDPYQPYFSETPHLSDPYRPRSPYSSPYGNDR